jgi:hypothetical protein
MLAHKLLHRTALSTFCVSNKFESNSDEFQSNQFSPRKRLSALRALSSTV